MAIVQAKCKCGNEDVSKFEEYDGCLGYEAVICKCCGRYWDMEGEHEPTTLNDTSFKFVMYPTRR